MRIGFNESMQAIFTNKLFNNYLFYAHLIMRCKLELTETLPAIAAVSFSVNKYNLYINPKLFNQLSISKRLGVLKHEMLHIVNTHLSSRFSSKLDMHKWNLATDCAINQFIDGDHLIEGCILPNNLLTDKSIKVQEKQNAEFYYKLLIENPDKVNEKSTQMDSHDDWTNENSEATDSVDDSLQREVTKSIIKSAMDDTIKNQGDVPNEISVWLELCSKNKEVNWTKILQHILGSIKYNVRKTILKPNRRNPSRGDLKGKVKDNRAEVLVIADESGSVTSKDEKYTLNEILNLCKVLDSSIDLIQVDTEASDPIKLNKNTLKFERKHKGGTMISSAIPKIKKPYDVIIILTDGELSNQDINNFITLNKPIIWLVIKHNYINPLMTTSKMKVIELKAN